MGLFSMFNKPKAEVKKPGEAKKSAEPFDLGAKLKTQEDRQDELVKNAFAKQDKIRDTLFAEVKKKNDLVDAKIQAQNEKQDEIVRNAFAERKRILTLLAEKSVADVDTRAKAAESIAATLKARGIETGRVVQIRSQAEDFNKFFSKSGVEVDEAPEQIAPLPSPKPEQIAPLPSPAPEQIAPLPSPAPEMIAPLPSPGPMAEKIRTSRVEGLFAAHEDVVEAPAAKELSPNATIGEVRASLNELLRQQTENVVAINREKRALDLQVRGTDEYRAVKVRLDAARNLSIELPQKIRNVRARFDEMSGLRAVGKAPEAAKATESPAQAQLALEHAAMKQALKDLEQLKSENLKSPAVFDKRKEIAEMSNRIAALEKQATQPSVAKAA